MRHCLLRIVMASLTLALPLVSFIAEAQAPSFDCVKARSVAEKLICATPALSAADDELARIYHRAKERIEHTYGWGDPDGGGLSLAAAGIRQWFKSDTLSEWNWREKNCHDVPCLAAWYNQRKALLLWIATSEDVLGDLGLKSVIPLPGGEVLLSYGMITHVRNVIFDPEFDHFRRFTNGEVVLSANPIAPLTLIGYKSYFREGGAFWITVDVDLQGRMYRIWGEGDRCMSRESFVSHTGFDAEDVAWLSQEQICYAS